MENSKESILESLEPLFERARREKKWFFCHYQELWFSPRELREKHSEGRFIWGVVNWDLRDPEELLIEWELNLEMAKTQLKNFKERIRREEEDGQ